VADAHFGGGPRLGCRSHCQARRRGWSSAQNRLRPCTEPNSSLDWGGQEHRAYPCTAAAEKCVRVQDVCLHALYHRERRVASTSGSAGLLHSAHTVAPCTSYPPCTSDALEQGYEVDNRRRARVGRGPGAERAARQAGRARARRRRPGRQRALELREPRTRRSLRRGAVRGGGRGLERLAAWRERRSLVGGTAAAAYCLWRCSQGSGKQGMPCAGHASAACAHTSLEKPDSVHSHPARQQRWLGQATWVTAVHAALTGHRAGRGRHPRTRSQAEDPHHLQRQCAVPAWAHLGRRAAQQGRPHAAWHACMPQPLFRPEARQGRPAQAVIHWRREGCMQGAGGGMPAGHARGRPRPHPGRTAARPGCRARTRGCPAPRAAAAGATLPAPSGRAGRQPRAWRAGHGTEVKIGSAKHSASLPEEQESNVSVRPGTACSSGAGTTRNCRASPSPGSSDSATERGADGCGHVDGPTKLVLARYPAARACKR